MQSETRQNESSPRRSRPRRRGHWGIRGFDVARTGLASSAAVLAMGCVIHLDDGSAGATGGAGGSEAPSGGVGGSEAASGAGGGGVGGGEAPGGAGGGGVGGGEVASGAGGAGGGGEVASGAGGTASTSSSNTCGCADGATDCSGACVDTSSDPAHCGACGSSCAAGESCCGGACVDLSSDGQHCGACGHDCQGGACDDAVCQPVALAEAAGTPITIRVDSTHVYWTHTDTGEIMKVNKAGGAPATIAVGCPSYGLAVNATNVYWSCSPFSGTPHDVPTGVYSAPLDGGAPVLLSTSGVEEPHGLAVDATNIYLGDSYYAVKKLPITGGAAVLIGTGTGARRVAVDATHVYWANSDASAIRKAPIEGGEAVTLASGYFESHEVVLDETHVYWTTPGEVPATGSVNRIPKEGGTPVALASGEQFPYYLAIDETHVYWYSTGVDEIRKVPREGGEPVVVISGIAANDLAVDGESIYWTDDNGFVMKLAK